MYQGARRSHSHRAHSVLDACSDLGSVVPPPCGAARVGNLVVVTWGCHGSCTGRHSTSTSEPISARTNYCG